MNSVIELIEATETRFPGSQIPQEIGWIIRENYSTFLDIEPPWSFADSQWKLRTKDTVGYLPLGSFGGILINPKIDTHNFFHMLSYAYKLKSFKVFEGTFQVEKLEDFYSFLAYKLSESILKRKQQGLYKEYISNSDISSTIKGRIDLDEVIRYPWRVRIPNTHDEHTEDIEDNQILLWTTYIISRNRFCNQNIARYVRKAHNTIYHLISLREIDFRTCVDRLYNRLNKDYESIHILCRFFLENVSPKHHVGKENMIPFAINMPRLYELFVAEWMKEHTPSGFQVITKKKQYIDTSGLVSIEIDIALLEKKSNKIVAVLDTKYKNPQNVPEDDIYQIAFYARKEFCKNAILIYPSKYSKKFSDNEVTVQCIPFLLDGDLEEQGECFMSQLLKTIDHL